MMASHGMVRPRLASERDMVTMRMILFAGFLCAAIVPAVADEVVDKATLDKVVALATRGYAKPEAATVRNVHKSAARNGLGYCGEVTVENGKDFTIFHAILAGSDGKGETVLRLIDYPDSDASDNAILVRRMMSNFGCTK